MASEPLPELLRPLFWDYDFDQLTWPDSRDLVISRVLQSGGDEAFAWLHRAVEDADLAQWLRRRRGRGIDPKQLRFWQAVLDLPSPEVDHWVEEAMAGPWWNK